MSRHKRYDNREALAVVTDPSHAEIVVRYPLILPPLRRRHRHLRRGHLFIFILGQTKPEQIGKKRRLNRIRRTIAPTFPLSFVFFSSSLLRYNFFFSKICRTAKKLQLRIKPFEIHLYIDRPSSVMVRARESRSGSARSNLGEAGSGLRGDITFQSPRELDFSFF